MKAVRVGIVALLLAGAGACGDVNLLREGEEDAPDAPDLPDDGASAWRLTKVAGSAYNATYVHGDDGSVALLVLPESPDGGAMTALHARIRDQGGEWRAPVVLSERVSGKQPPSIVALAAGGYAAGWIEDRELVVARFDGTRWLTPVVVSRDLPEVPGTIDDIVLAIADDGRLAALVRYYTISTHGLANWAHRQIELDPVTFAALEVVPVDDDPSCGRVRLYRQAEQDHVLAECGFVEEQSIRYFRRDRGEATYLDPVTIAVPDRWYHGHPDLAFDRDGGMHLTFDVSLPCSATITNQGPCWQVMYREGISGSDVPVSGSSAAVAAPEITVDGDNHVLISYNTAIFSSRDADNSEVYLGKTGGILGEADESASATFSRTFDHERVSDASTFSRRPHDLGVDPTSGVATLIFQVPLNLEGEADVETGWWFAERVPLPSAELDTTAVAD